MRQLQLLRILSVLGFLTLFAPFYQGCGKEAATTTTTVDSTTVEITIAEEIDTISRKVEMTTPKEPDTISKTVETLNIGTEECIETETEPLYIKACHFINDGSTDNIFEMVTDFEDYTDLSKQAEQESFLWKIVFIWAYPLRILSFLLIIIFSFMMIVLAFRNKTGRLHVFAATNLFLAIKTIIDIVYFTFSRGYDSVKWGYHVFIIIQILLIIVSKRLIYRQKKETATA